MCVYIYIYICMDVQMHLCTNVDVHPTGKSVIVTLCMTIEFSVTLECRLYGKWQKIENLDQVHNMLIFKGFLLCIFLLPLFLLYVFGVV